MSRLAWANTMTPAADAPVEDLVYDLYEPAVVVPRTRAIDKQPRQMVTLPERRAYRSLSRSGVMLSAVGLPAAETLAGRLAADPYRVGIYCALDAGPQNYRACKELLATPTDQFAERFRKLNHPKLYLTQLVNLPAAQLGIFLAIHGPVNVYSHSVAAAIHALDNAEFDLARGIVDAALVCSAFSFEDPLLTLRARADCPPPRILGEGAAALVLVADGAETDWADWNAAPGASYYGPADTFIQIAQKEIQ